ncbi:hypothetical protein [Lactococcus lactis]|uniref:hypothetical protein n=2 Tax=Lactococcus lactis TaxID=1358 RepID=UPI00071E45BB|nr:hypothetical protein [Lactococcus lactis]KST95067.1 hypothetical protein KF146_1987 [Lactococcus lactis subsp. lactis]MDU0396990.1 hypothetical protein [Lactococcus lactis]
MFPVLIFFSIFILIYIFMAIAIVLTAFINAFRENENIDESFSDRFDRLNKEYFYTLFKKGYKPKKDTLPEWIRWISGFTNT